MAPLLTDGVPGLEGIHVLGPPSPWPSLALNDWMDPSTGLVQLPHTRLQQIAGLYDKADADDPRANLVNRIGEAIFPRQQRGKTITYSGVAVGATLSSLRDKVAKMRAACDTLSSNPGGWTITANYDPTYDPTSMVFTAYGIPVGFTSPDVQGSGDQSPSPYQRGFDLSFRLHDPRWWATTPGAISVGGASGTAHVLTMTGTAPSEPTFTFTSGGPTILIHHAELSCQLQLVLPGAMTGPLIINFFHRTITDNGVDVTGYIDWPNTDWWGEAASGSPLLIGTNTITGTGGPWTVSALPAVW
jgi:hypothetical protein